MSVRQSWAAAALLLLLLLALLGLGAWQDAAVVDEHPHILSGILYWQSGSFAGGFDNPPLGQLWMTVPFELLHIDYRFPDDSQVIWARLPVMALTLLWVVCVALWANAAGGLWVATTVVGLFCLEPNVLAHGHLATLDAPLACAWWATLWFLRQWLLGRSPAAWGVCLAMAMALLIKFTALLLFPVVFLLGLLHRPSRDALVRTTLLCAAALSMSWVLAWLVYGFDGQQFGWPRAFVEAMLGKWQHRADGHFAYLAGRRSMQGFPEYNLVALALKTPLPLLLLAGAGLVVHWRSWQRLDRLLLLLPAGVLLLVFSVGGVHIGVRHLLPIYPVLLFCAACGLLALLGSPGWRRAVATFLLVWWMAGIARISPQWIPYFNELAGGPAHGDRWLLDSNLDWGQDDARLEAFLQRQQQQGETWWVNPPALVPRTGQLVVNVNALHGLLRMHDEHYAWLRRQVPTGHVGWSWKTWKLTPETYAQGVRDHPQDEDRLLDYARILQTHGNAADALALLQSQQAILGGHGWQAAVEIALDADRLADAEIWVEGVPHELRQEERWSPLLLRLQLQKQLAQNRDDARSQLELGLYWAQMGEWQRAAPFLQAAATAMPQDVDSQRAWVMWLGQMGRHAEAAAVASRPAVSAALRHESVVLSSAAATRQQLEQALESGGTVDLQSLREFAQSEFAAERYDRAASALVQLLRQEPADRNALHLLGEMQVRSKLRVVGERLQPRSLRAIEPASAEGRTTP